MTGLDSVHGQGRQYPPGHDQSVTDRRLRGGGKRGYHRACRQPAAHLAPIEPVIRPKKLGALKGKLKVADDFNKPSYDEEFAAIRVNVRLLLDTSAPGRDFKTQPLLSDIHGSQNPAIRLQ
ncbi:MAG TPA: hypothetical protein VE734_05745 [Terriglobales bacterium]|nr:hypothetical protein [Terriglobales bacterium]